MDSARLERLGVRLETERPGEVGRVQWSDRANRIRDYALSLERTIDELAAEVERLRGIRPKTIAEACAHIYESNPGLWDTSRRYCAVCGRVEP